jgi:hypothetical protein
MRTKRFSGSSQITRERRRPETVWVGSRREKALQLLVARFVEVIDGGRLDV